MVSAMHANEVPGSSGMPPTMKSGLYGSRTTPPCITMTSLRSVRTESSTSLGTAMSLITMGPSPSMFG